MYLYFNFRVGFAESFSCLNPFVALFFTPIHTCLYYIVSMVFLTDLVVMFSCYFLALEIYAGLWIMHLTTDVALSSDPFMR